MSSYKKYTYLLLLLLGVGYTGWLLFQSTHLSLQITKGDQYRPDSFMKQIQGIETNPQGKISRRLTSTYVQHYPKQDKTQLTQPIYTIYQNNEKQPWTITAHFGTSYDGGKKILLTHQVNIHEPPGKHNEDIRILTEQLTYLPKQDIATTPAFVTIKKPNLLVTAIGMKAYLAQKKINLLSHTRGIYEPEKTAS